MKYLKGVKHMRGETRAKLHRLQETLLSGWTREIRHPERPCGNATLMDDPNHPIR